ncbi:hypothetical protein DFP72DRAFT_1097993 [Ephemerocybe angulata]|uniref:Uncharacterized protein n=1 Tax=Ephemerocybe angulata TaxID=980116 RepID=A0A8H6HDH5_9AGAR|nr:hypothetical protein DFP72DRAFT_1097993 [Tulosesus angulatus]
MRVPLLALLPFALGTLASLANAHDVDAREIRARSFHDDSALELRDSIASLSTRDLIDALSERLERRWSVFCNNCKLYLRSPDNVKTHKNTFPGHVIAESPQALDVHEPEAGGSDPITIHNDPGIYPIYDRCTIRTKPPPSAAGARFLSGHLGSKAEPTQIGSPDIWVLRHLEVDRESGQMTQWILPCTQCLVPWVFKFGDPPPGLPVVQARSINAKFDISAKKREKSRKSRKNWNVWAGSGVRTRTPGARETWIFIQTFGVCFGPNLSGQDPLWRIYHRGVYSGVLVKWVVEKPAPAHESEG